MVALVDDVPRTLNLRDALVAYVDHQIEVITRRSQYRLDKAPARPHRRGPLKALDMIDADHRPSGPRDRRRRAMH
jgi:DNA gyrase subunit A